MRRRVVQTDQGMEMLAREDTLGANLLFHAGPLPEGSIYPADVKILLEVGCRQRKT